VGSSRVLERLEYRLSPRAINTYNQCPRKFFHQYVRNVKMPFEFSSGLAIGNVTHKALAEIFLARKAGLPEPDIEACIWKYLRTQKYPEENGDELREDHFHLILEHVSAALRMLPAGAEVLEVEREFDYHLASFGLAITSRVDLVVRHGDGLIDHIDFKTGRQGGDPIQNVMSRVAVLNTLAVASDRIRTVNGLTGTHTYAIVPGDRDAHIYAWHLVKDRIREILGDNDWLPRPDPDVCRWCDFKTICDDADLGSENELAF
jgi:PD-(D/E)XK nuclease superfamily protein